jgi:hypothetical protein
MDWLKIIERHVATNTIQLNRIEAKLDILGKGEIVFLTKRVAALENLILGLEGK